MIYSRHKINVKRFTLQKWIDNWKLKTYDIRISHPFSSLWIPSLSVDECIKPVLNSSEPVCCLEISLSTTALTTSLNKESTNSSISGDISVKCTSVSSLVSSAVSRLFQSSKLGSNPIDFGVRIGGSLWQVNRSSGFKEAMLSAGNSMAVLRGSWDWHNGDLDVSSSVLLSDKLSLLSDDEWAWDTEISFLVTTTPLSCRIFFSDVTTASSDLAFLLEIWGSTVNVDEVEVGWSLEDGWSQVFCLRRLLSLWLHRLWRSGLTGREWQNRLLYL